MFISAAAVSVIITIAVIVLAVIAIALLIELVVVPIVNALRMSIAESTALRMELQSKSLSNAMTGVRSLNPFEMGRALGQILFAISAVVAITYVVVKGAVSASAWFLGKKAGATTTTAAGGAAVATQIPHSTVASVQQKLQKYLLNLTHPVGGSKAKWFNNALGFNQSNWRQLANQIVFDANTAIQTTVTEYGIKFSQIIRITGANGRVIDVTFIWIENHDGIIRLVTSIPTPQ